jgi:hypothetical protein
MSDLRWDPRRGKFVDDRVDMAERMRAAAKRLGITLENAVMTEKNALVPYLEGKDTPSDRGRTSVDADASEHETHQKLIAVARRVGKKLARIEVVNPAGEMIAVWKAHEGALTREGHDMVLPISEQETDVKKAKKTKAAGKKPAKKTSGPGVIATIVETISRASGASLDEITTVLVKKFPDRKKASMEATAKIQASRNAKRKEKSEKRGLVYYG